MHRETLVGALALALLIGAASGPQGAGAPSSPSPAEIRILPAQTESEAPAEPEEVKGSEKKGKFYFKQICKDCHGKDSKGGEITPISKTIKQWERFFKKGIHYGEQPVDSLATKIELIHIETFLVAHAADSDQPETCK